MGLFGDIFGGLGSFGGNLANMLGAAGKGGKGSLQEAVGVWDKLKDPNFDFRSLTAPELQVIAEQAPQVYDAIIPREFKGVVDSAMRGQQVGSLGQMNAIAGQQGMGIEDRLATQEAQRAMAQENQRAQSGVMRSMAERGRLGAGDEIQARLMANQQGAEAGRGLSSDIVRQAMARRLGAIQSAGQMAGQIRSGDVDVSARNADITNRFNELAAGLQNQAAQYAAQERSRTQAANVGNRQRIAETNTLGRYQNQQDNLNRQNALRQQQYANSVTKAGGKANALGGLAQGQYAEQAANAQNIRSLGQSSGQMVGGAGDLYLAGSNFTPGSFGSNLQWSQDPLGSYLKQQR